MAEVFPGTLEEKFNVSGFNVIEGETKTRTNNDTGIPNVRARFTKGIHVYNASFDLPQSDITTFRTWYQTTLANGTKTFLFDDPLTGAESEFRFVGVPRYRPLGNGGVYFNVSFTWEILP